MKRKADANVSITQPYKVTRESKDAAEVEVTEARPLSQRVDSLGESPTSHTQRHENTNDQARCITTASVKDSIRRDNEDIRKELDRRIADTRAKRRELEVETERVSVERLILMKLAKKVDSHLSSLREDDLRQVTSTVQPTL